MKEYLGLENLKSAVGVTWIPPSIQYYLTDTCLCYEWWREGRKLIVYFSGKDDVTFATELQPGRSVDDGIILQEEDFVKPWYWLMNYEKSADYIEGLKVAVEAVLNQADLVIDAIDLEYPDEPRLVETGIYLSCALRILVEANNRPETKALYERIAALTTKTDSLRRKISVRKARKRRQAKQALDQSYQRTNLILMRDREQWEIRRKEIERRSFKGRAKRLWNFIRGKR